MRVSVRLFAVARQLGGRERVELELPEGAVVGLLRRRLIEEVPQLADVSGLLMFALGTQYAEDSHVVPPDADVACIPPVSGG